ncbi:MAG: ABC transporter permease [Deltaproteobacteria bacterium]|nr:ABC transporter permease [Deltaproteobacteria bacterium]
MKNIIAIFRRETLSFFVSPIAYFVITGFVLLGAYFFIMLLSYFDLALAEYARMPRMGGPVPNLNQWVIEGYFQTLLVILVFLIPLLTMRTLAEERHRGTYELLATSPLSIFEIVLGKFLGVAFVVTLMIVLAGAFPLLICIWGNPEVKPLLSGLLGMLLFGLAFSSIGMAVSSFTENQIVAAISSMVALLMLYMIHSPAQSLGGTGADILMYLSPVMQVRDLMRGVVTLKSLVYFLSLISLGLFLSQRALDAQRWR